MNKIFGSAVAAALSAVMLTGCTFPGTNNKSGKNKMSDSYSYSPEVEQAEGEIYTWLIKPSIQADNIISFDASRIDPDIADNRSYINYSVIRQSGRYGLIDYAGNMMIKPEYDDYYVCRCGEIVLVNIIDDRHGEYEYCTLNPDKQITSQPAHTTDDSPVYYTDIVSGKIFEGKRGSDEVSEYTGKRSVAVTQANIELDDYGSMKVSVPEDALCGLAKNGSLIVDCQYDAYYAPAYKSGNSTYIAFMNASGKWGYLDGEGNVIIDFICDGDPNAYNGMVTDDQMLTHPYLFCDEYIPVYKDGYYSYYDYEGEQAVRAGEFGQARPVNNGRAWVKQNDFWGVIQLGEIIEEEKPEESSTPETSTSPTSWTTTTSVSESDYDLSDTWPATDELGNPITTSNTELWTESTDIYTEEPNTDWTEPEYTEPQWTEPEYTEPVYTEPVYTEPPVYDPTPEYFE